MNNNNSILLKNPAFDPTTASACNLLIKIGLDSFSYAVVNNSTQQVMALYDEQECDISSLNFDALFEKNELLNLAYQQVQIATYSDSEISIPNEFFDENSIELHSKLIKNNTVVSQFQQKHFGFTTIFGLQKNIETAINNQFSKLKLYPHYAGLLAFAENIKETSLFLDFSANSFTALFIKDEKVIFQKCYETANTEEFNYFILLLINQLTIAPSEIAVHLSGIIHLDDHKYQCLQKYFSKIEFTKLPTQLNVELLEDMPTHYYTNLLALTQCEL
jgi:hypothetical protein